MKEKFKTLQIIHLALAMGMILAYALIGGMDVFTSFKFSNFETIDALYISIPFLAFYLSNFLYKSQIKQIDKTVTLDEQLPAYLTASIIRWAILEGAAFLMLFVGASFMLLGVLIIAYFVFIRPTLDKMKSEVSF